MALASAGDRVLRCPAMIVAARLTVFRSLVRLIVISDKEYQQASCFSTLMCGRACIHISEVFGLEVTRGCPFIALLGNLRFCDRLFHEFSSSVGLNSSRESARRGSRVGWMRQ